MQRFFVSTAAAAACVCIGGMNEKRRMHFASLLASVLLFERKTRENGRTFYADGEATRRVEREIKTLRDSDEVSSSFSTV